MTYKPRQTYTHTQRQQAIRAVLNGEQPGAVARRLRIVPNTLYAWVCLARKELGEQAEAVVATSPGGDDFQKNLEILLSTLDGITTEQNAKADALYQEAMTEAQVVPTAATGWAIAEAGPADELLPGFVEVGRPGGESEVTPEALNTEASYLVDEVRRLRQQLAQRTAERDYWAQKAMAPSPF